MLNLSARIQDVRKEAWTKLPRLPSYFSWPFWELLYVRELPPCLQVAFGSSQPVQDLPSVPKEKRHDMISLLQKEPICSLLLPPGLASGCNRSQPVFRSSQFSRENRSLKEVTHTGRMGAEALSLELNGEVPSPYPASGACSTHQVLLCCLSAKCLGAEELIVMFWLLDLLGCQLRIP